MLWVDISLSYLKADFIMYDDDAIHSNTGKGITSRPGLFGNCNNNMVRTLTDKMM